MGYIRHHAIIITGYNLKSLHKKAIKLLGEQVSNICKSPMNGYESFFIAPNGSKEGWEDSDIGDINREKFISIIKNKVTYIELYYGDDNKKAEILNHN